MAGLFYLNLSFEIEINIEQPLFFLLFNSLLTTGC